jgi:hypothetical protein
MTNTKENLPQKFDGIYFLPSSEQDSTVKYLFFDLSEEFVSSQKVDHSSIGDCFHIAFVRPNEKGMPILNDHFEAILIDPMTYLRTLIGTDIYGCIVRKTEKSHLWFNQYVNRMKELV